MKRRKFLRTSAGGLGAVTGMGLAGLGMGGTGTGRTANQRSPKKSLGATLKAGRGKSDITRRQAAPVVGDMAMKAALGIAMNAGIKIHDPLFVKALVLDDGSTRLAILTMDVVAIGFGTELPSDFLLSVRTRIEKELNISGKNVLVNASHNHCVGGQIADDVVDKTVDAVRQACANLVPVKIGAGRGTEDRISMNRRIRLKNGRAWTERQANPSPEDEDVAGVGPIDPEIGILRIDTLDDKPFAVVYNFTAHPYIGASGGGVTAELPGFASKVIEDELGDDALALFVQGAEGDVEEILYKDVNRPRNSEPLGLMLGLSTLKAWRSTQTGNGTLRVVSETFDLPRRQDLPARIQALEEEQNQLLKSLIGTSLNFKTFLPLYIQYRLHPEYPSYYAYWYLHQQTMGRTEQAALDAENKKNIEKYLNNVYAMEKLARIQTNLGLLRNCQAMIEKSGSATVPVEVQVFKIGDFVLVTFPGEMFVEIGLNIKKASPFKYTFIAGVSNAFIGYCPTDAAFEGWAYEDSSSQLGAGWQQIFEKKVAELLRRPELS